MPNAVVNITSTTTVIAAQGSGKRIRLDGGHLSSAGANVVRLKDEAGNYLSGQLNSLNGAGGKLDIVVTKGLSELLCADNSGLVIEYGSGTSNIGGWLTWSTV